MTPGPIDAIKLANMIAKTGFFCQKNAMVTGKARQIRKVRTKYAIWFYSRDLSLLPNQHSVRRDIPLYLPEI